MGTDTMAYTATALSFMLENLMKPVIFTGSQIPLAEPHTDARQNLNGLDLCSTRSSNKRGNNILSWKVDPCMSIYKRYALTFDCLHLFPL